MKFLLVLMIVVPISQANLAWTNIQTTDLSGKEPKVFSHMSHC